MYAAAAGTGRGGAGRALGWDYSISPWMSTNRSAATLRWLSATTADSLTLCQRKETGEASCKLPGRVKGSRSSFRGDIEKNPALIRQFWLKPLNLGHGAPQLLASPSAVSA